MYIIIRSQHTSVLSVVVLTTFGTLLRIITVETLTRIYGTRLKNFSPQVEDIKFLTSVLCVACMHPY